MKKSRGLIIGKFMPPHRGHQYLIEAARKRVDELTVIVFTKSYEPIPGELRYGWMQQLYPDLEVLNIHDDYPTDFNNPKLWELRMAMIHEAYPHQPDFVFSSEPYGDELAKRLDAQAIVVDQARENVPVSATMIREQPLQYWDYIPHCVRPYFVKRVAIVGSESLAKAQVMEALTQHYNTVQVPDAIEEWTEASDIERIADEQKKLEDKLAVQANRVLFCNTDLMEFIAARKYDLYLLIPPIANDIRGPLTQAVNENNLTYRMLSGTIQEQIEIAKTAIDALLA